MSDELVAAQFIGGKRPRQPVDSGSFVVRLVTDSDQLQAALVEHGADLSKLAVPDEPLVERRRRWRRPLHTRELMRMLLRASGRALDEGEPLVTARHIFLGLAQEPESRGARALARTGIDTRRLVLVAERLKRPWPFPMEEHERQRLLRHLRDQTRYLASLATWACDNPHDPDVLLRLRDDVFTLRETLDTLGVPYALVDNSAWGTVPHLDHEARWPSAAEGS